MKTLKYLFITFVLFVAATHSHASALPYFSNLRTEITNQLTIASNAPVVSKPAIAKLKAALKIIDKPTTNTLAAYTKTLTTLIPSLNKTAVSNIFDPEIQIVLDSYTTEYVAANNSLMTQLATAFPGAKNIAAQKALAKLQASISGVSTNPLSNAAAKHLASASKNLIASSKAVTTAKNAPAPAAFINVTLSPNGAAKATLASKPPFAAFQSANPGTGAFIINASQLKGRTLNNLFCNFVIPTTGGTHTVSASGVYTVIGELPYTSSSGQATVTWNKATKNVFGTLTFNVSNGVRTGTLTSTFNLYHP